LEPMLAMNVGLKPSPVQKWIVLCLLSLTVFGLGGILANSYWQRVATSPLIPPAGQMVTIQLPKGSHFQGLIQQLEALGLLRSSIAWRIYGRISQPLVRAGEYRLEPGEGIRDLLAKVEQGQIVQHRLTIVEGWTVARLREALASEPRLEQATALWSDQELMESLGCPDCWAEGRFLPETYVYVRGDSDFELLHRAWLAMQDAVQEAWMARDPSSPLNDPDELLIMASLIERETAVPSERTTIAGVFARRLEKGMRLQTDPTVIYGLGDAYNGRLTRADLRTDHPWNTYTRGGLPTTAIALPGLASLLAAGQPEAGQALYFVAKGDGTHVFSNTLDEHNEAVNRYIRGIP